MQQPEHVHVGEQHDENAVVGDDFAADGATMAQLAGTAAGERRYAVG